LAILLINFADVFASHEYDLGEFELLEHEIKLHDMKPFRERIRRTPLCFEQEEEKTLNHMLSTGVIQPSTSEWASAPVLVRKKDGSLRYCIDYRSLNRRTIKDAYPLPLIEECLDMLNGSQFFTCLDMASGYWQISVKPEDRPKTAFVTKHGLFEHVRMGFGLCNAPATFSRAVNLLLRGMTNQQVLAYLDDVIVLGKTFEEQVTNLREAFLRFRAHHLKLKPKKCHLFQVEIDFLGRRVNADGVSIQNAKVEVVKEWATPRKKTELSSFLGTVNYHRDFIANFAKIAEPLYRLLGKKTEFVWGEEQEEAFRQLKQCMSMAPVLSYPNGNDDFILDCDASNYSIGAELLQVQDGRERVIAYSSYILTPAQRKYCTTRKELLALVTFTRHFRHYLLGRKILVRTDHASLAWIMRFKHIEGQLARWCEELAQYDMTVVHRSGVKHTNADGLSRMPDPVPLCNCYEAGKSVESLPCGGCKFCQRCHSQWERFEVDVDDVVPIAIRRVGSELVDPEDDPDLRPEVTEFEGYSLEQLRELQVKDPDLGPVLAWLESKDPSEAELFRQSSCTKHIWSCRSQLRLVSGVLYYCWEYVTHKKLKLVVPAELKQEVMALVHDTLSGGHFGRDKTIERARKSFHWFGLTRDLTLYVATCGTCKTSKKPTRTPRRGLGDYQAGSRLERVHLDILGPFVESKKGNKYVLMITDQFTKWVSCLPLPNQTAEQIVWAFYDHFIAYFGCPLQIHTDQGRNFDGNYFKALCELLQIAKTRTTPYRPNSNGQVETYNRVVLRFLRCFLDGKQRDWDRYISSVGMSLRASVSKSTGFTPNFLMFGQEVNTPVEILMGLPAVNQERHEPAEYVTDLNNVLQEAYQTVRKNLNTVQKRQKKQYDAKIRECNYAKGDFVYKLVCATKVGESSKLRPIFQGPYLVTKVISPALYRIDDRKKSVVVHHDKLTRCIDRQVPFWLRKKRHDLLGADSVDVVDVEPVEEPIWGCRCKFGWSGSGRLVFT
jgi:hypothetical protein